MDPDRAPPELLCTVIVNCPFPLVAPELDGPIQVLLGVAAAQAQLLVTLKEPTGSRKVARSVSSAKRHKCNQAETLAPPPCIQRNRITVQTVLSASVMAKSLEAAAFQKTYLP